MAPIYRRLVTINFYMSSTRNVLIFMKFIEALHHKNDIYQKWAVIIDRMIKYINIKYKAVLIKRMSRHCY